MVNTTVKKEDFSEILLPFKYEDVLIYSKTFGITPGLYGYKNDSLFFAPLDILPDTFDIESPESVEELQEFMTSLDYIVQRVSMNPKITLVGHLKDSDPKIVLEPFVTFSTSFEKNMHILEGLKNEY